MADSKINDYLGEYFLEKVSSWDRQFLRRIISRLMRLRPLQRIGATFTKISSIKDPPYKPIECNRENFSSA